MPAPSLITISNPLRFIYPGVASHNPPILKPLQDRKPSVMTSITKTYLLPAILLNPVLLLHTFNTIASRMPMTMASSSMPRQPLPTFGPAATSPFIDVHANDNLCWSYTVVMVGVQLVAFGQVSGNREAGRRRKAELKQEEDERKALETEADTDEETDEEMA